MKVNKLSDSDIVDNNNYYGYSCPECGEQLGRFKALFGFHICKRKSYKYPEPEPGTPRPIGACVKQGRIK